MSDDVVKENQIKPKLSNTPGSSKNSTMQVLVSSNSNNSAALRSETKSGVESSQVPLLKDQMKFKSLGDLHMEKGLPSLPRYCDTYLLWLQTFETVNSYYYKIKH